LSLFTRFSAAMPPSEAAVDAMDLSLKMLGGFELRDGGGAELSLPTRKVRALLSYLAVNANKPQPRERLMALLWSDRGERQARQSLNQALLSIRRLRSWKAMANA
jgi:DNA-binding SARP family transcriptional activator